MVEGADDVDADARPVATSTKDALGVPSFVRLAVDTATCTDDGSGCVVSACDVMATLGRATSTTDASGASSSIHPTAEVASCADDGSRCAVSTYDVAVTSGRATFATGALDMPPSVCSPTDIDTGYALPVNATAAPVPLPLASGVMPTGS